MHYKTYDGGLNPWALNADVPLQIPGLVGWYDVERSMLRAARDGSGSVPTDGGLIGWIEDLSPSGYHMASLADGDRPAWYADCCELGLPGIYSDANNKTFVNQPITAHFGGNPPSFTALVVKMHRRTNSTVEGLDWAAAAGAIASNPHVYVGDFESLYVTTNPRVRVQRRNTTTTTTTDHNRRWGGNAAWIVKTLRVDGATGMDLFVNGLKVATTAGAWGNVALSASHWTTLCGLYTGAGYTAHRPLFWFAFALWNRVLADAELVDLHRYYLRRLRFKGYSPTFDGVNQGLCTFCLGESHTEGSFQSAHSLSNNTGTWAKRLVSRLPYERTFQLTNHGIGDQPMAAAGGDNDIWDAWTYVQGLFAARNGSILAMTGGAQDVFFDNNPTTGVAPTSNAEAEEIVNHQIFGEGTGAPTNTFPQLVIDVAETKNSLFIGLTDPPPGSTSGLTALAFRAHAMGHMRTRKLAYVGRFDRAQMFDWYIQLKESGSDYLDETAWESAKNDGLHLNRQAHELAADGVAAVYEHLQTNPKDFAAVRRWWTSRTGSAYTTDGAAVSSLTDRSTAAAHATQATASLRPAWYGNQYNYRPAIRFDGVDDRLEFTALTVAATDLGSFFGTGGDGCTFNRLGIDGLAQAFNGDLGDVMILDGSAGGTSAGILNTIGSYLAYKYGKTWTAIT